MEIKKRWKIGEIEKIGNGGKFNAMYQEKNESDSSFKSGSIKHGWVTWRIALFGVFVWY